MAVIVELAYEGIQWGAMIWTAYSLRKTIQHQRDMKEFLRPRVEKIDQFTPPNAQAIVDRVLAALNKGVGNTLRIHEQRHFELNWRICNLESITNAGGREPLQEEDDTTH